MGIEGRLQPSPKWLHMHLIYTVTSMAEMQSRAGLS